MMKISKSERFVKAKYPEARLERYKYENHVGFYFIVWYKTFKLGFGDLVLEEAWQDAEKTVRGLEIKL